MESNVFQLVYLPLSHCCVPVVPEEFLILCKDLGEKISSYAVTSGVCFEHHFAQFHLSLLTAIFSKPCLQQRKQESSNPLS